MRGGKNRKMTQLSKLTIESLPALRRPQLIAGEFVIEGSNLREQCERATKDTFDVVSPLGWAPAEYQATFAERLLLRQPAILPSGRRELLVCPECADLGCGCISAEVVSDGDCFLWDKLGYENNYDPAMLTIFPMRQIVIAKTELLRQLRKFVPDLQEF